MGIMAENDQIRSLVWESVNGLTDQQLNDRLDPEKWTIAQVLIHLYLFERGVTKQLKTAIDSDEEQPADLKPIHLTTNRSKKIKAPAQLEPRDEFTSMEDIQAKLSRSREALNSVLFGVREEELEKKSIPHRIYGQMNLKQWVEFVGLHEKRHIEQIYELKQEVLGQ